MLYYIYFPFLADAISRGKLHEMLVPSAFGQSWINEDNIVRLNSYYIKFCPYPEDRVYKEFGLFIMVRLPMEAEKLELDLHLAHGRSVMTMFVPFGVVEFNKDEVSGVCMCVLYFILRILLINAWSFPSCRLRWQRIFKKCSSKLFLID